MVTFNKNGTKVIVANEGEPDLINPKGSISIIDLSSSVNLVNQTHVKTLDFSRFNNSLPPNVRNFPGVPFDEDVEPEYITVSSDNNRAFITLQENNSIAVVDLSLDTIISIQGLGYINHNSSGFGFDASDRDSRVNISNYPVFGMFMPDAIASFDIFGTTYLFTANEGDDRGETQRVKNLSLDPTFFPNGTFLKQDSVLGRLNVSTIEGDFDNDSDYDSLFSYGTRSFSIWNANTATLIYDSGDDFESIIASNNPIYFNSDNNDNTSFDSRSDNKGPEPEAIEIAEINGAIFAFIGLERMGGIMVYNVTNPSQPIFIDYYNNRNFNVVETDTAVGDLGVECIRFISSTASPDGKSYVITANEVSGSISIFEVINLTTNVNMVEKNNLSLQIFPNPVNDHLFVKLNNGEFFDDLKIIIFDQMGRTLTRETIHSFQNNQYEVDFSSYGKGMYTVHFVVNNESYSFTVIK
jgi:2',3'-cyclic-nucleotide 2'-phosphodiesterase/3'-nucleotidase/5'-nucleotidase